MELPLREQLSELAERLHLHRGAGEDRALAAHEEVQRALADEDHQGLTDRLSELAVDFENDHPDLAMAIRRVADALGAAGI